MPNDEQKPYLLINEDIRPYDQVINENISPYDQKITRYQIVFLSDQEKRSIIENLKNSPSEEPKNYRLIAINDSILTAADKSYYIERVHSLICKVENNESRDVIKDGENEVEKEIVRAFLKYDKPTIGSDELENKVATVMESPHELTTIKECLEDNILPEDLQKTKKAVTSFTNIKETERETCTRDFATVTTNTDGHDEGSIYKIKVSEQKKHTFIDCCEKIERLYYCPLDTSSSIESEEEDVRIQVPSIDEITIKKVITILQDINKGVKHFSSPNFSFYGLFFDVESVKLQRNLQRDLPTEEKINLIEDYLSKTRSTIKESRIEPIMNRREDLLGKTGHQKYVR